ncbi:hypothetical protein JQS43_02225 [Natronosporangium hydrolyticum]|uniref:Uncharacterized protein n=1 Tax=Natronosporangium hydrolyticum TaxID=2811111 RepID=A0A895YMR5_9ACTN|nr:hypothetical protein [Natronosporangium hydrolyticum]QSB15208.1 hypothetical protein JQS43_02225 [Natronosporangium hydrolyticum]
MSPEPDRTVATVLPAAIELTTAYAAGPTDPELFWQTMQRLLLDRAEQSDPPQAVAELLLGTAALASMLLDEAAECSGRERPTILAELHRTYLNGP